MTGKLRSRVSLVPALANRLNQSLRMKISSFLPKVSIGVKIFGVATSMLAFTIVVVYISYDRIKKVNNELIDIAQYFTPLTASVAAIDVEALEQEIHIERILRLSKIEPLDRLAMQLELQQFQERGQTIDREIEKAIALSNQAVQNATIAQNIVEFARIEPLFQSLEEQHQQLHDRELELANLLRQYESNRGNFLEDKIKEEAESTQAEIKALIAELRNSNRRVKEQIEAILALEPETLNEINLLDPEQTDKAQFLEEQIGKEKNDFDQKIESMFLELEALSDRAVLSAAEHERDILKLYWILAIAATLVGLTYASLITLGLVDPVKRLLGGTREVERGNLNVRVAIASRDEIETLAEVFNEMVEGLQEKERIKATFGQYVDPRIVDDLIRQHSSQLEGGRKQIGTVFFSDVAGFSATSEILTPGRLLNLINQYLTLAADPIARYHGAIDKFIGDAVTAFWSPPFVSEADHAKFACYAALEQFVQLEKLRQMMPELMGFRKGLPEVNIRVGLATSELLAGNIGSEQFKSYTVMGSAVQVAEQLESANKQYGTRILVEEETRKRAAEAIETREIDAIYTIDRQPVRVYELLGRKGELDPILAEWRDRFERGLSAYRDRDWNRAKSEFAACLHLKADDRATQLYLERIEQLQENPPPEEWDGVWETIAERKANDG